MGDFINLWPHDINDLIFQNLDGKDILNATLVSPEWNQFLTRSSALKKIVIVPKAQNDLRDLGVLLRSTRKYRHFKVVDMSEISKYLVEIIANPYHKFNTITICRTTFEKKKQIEQIILNSCSSIEKYSFVGVEFQEEDEDLLSASYDCPRLKQLQLVYSPRYPPSINRYFDSFDNLESLCLINGCDENFKNLIKKSKNLKKLEIAGNFFDNDFFKDLSREMPSRLEEFIFNNILSSSKDDRNLKFFNDFFTSQSKTLKQFKTDALIEPDEIENAFKMSNLTELCVKGFHYNVELMQIHLENLRNSQTPMKPSNLKIFHVHYMDEILFELLALNAPNLKELKVRRFEPIDVSNPAYFDKLETVSIHYFNIELKERILRKDDNDRTHLEKLVLNAVMESTNEIQPLLWLEVDPY